MPKQLATRHGLLALWISVVFALLSACSSSAPPPPPPTAPPPTLVASAELLTPALPTPTAVPHPTVAAAAPTTPPVPSPTVTASSLITPTEARQIVQTYIDRLNEANAALDTARLRQIESGWAITLDDAVFANLRGQKRSAVPDGKWIAADIAVYVPRQIAFPGQLLAVITLMDQVHQAPWRSLVLFEKTTARAPWLATFRTTLISGFNLPPLLLDRDGYAEIVADNQVASLKTDPRHLGAEFATYLTNYSGNHESATSIFADGPATSQARTDLKNEVAQPNIKMTASFDDAEFSRPSFRLGDGGALSLFVLSQQKTAASTRADLGVVQDDQRLTLSGLMPPGTYTELAFQGFTTYAASVPSARSSVSVDILAQLGTTTDITAVPAAAGAVNRQSGPSTLSVTRIDPAPGTPISAIGQVITTEVQYDLGRDQKLAWVVAFYATGPDPDNPGQVIANEVDLAVTGSGTESLVIPLDGLSAELTETRISFYLAKKTLEPKATVHWDYVSQQPIVETYPIIHGSKD